MNSELLNSGKRAVSCSLRLRLALIAILALSGVGCASFNGKMASAPERSGAPPYAGDPEANGNPQKAWWN
jgi:hypothetical protein